ncbi:DUF305 domain-containing protein [Glaciibacter sp. 2TAF33]|uniref:DUF305 domain-containing protein n=1 Tax=Glaciibacter sp. 2TAF33 TaxID=3233015 RepID=UPI003F90ACB7
MRQARSPKLAAASHPSPSPPTPRRGRTALLVTALVTAVMVGLVGWSAGRLSTLDNPDPSNTSAEAGFARDMQVHHDQGVELSLIVRDRTDDEATRLLAYDIITTQGQQSGQMFGWLSAWGLPQAPSEPSMTWMTRPGRGDGGHQHSRSDPAHAPGEPMPGLATPEQIESLRAATGAEAERIFLTLMIAHHQGALDMADAVLDRATDTTVLSFATGVVASQKSEITLMESMLAELP